MVTSTTYLYLFADLATFRESFMTTKQDTVTVVSLSIHNFKLTVIAEVSISVQDSLLIGILNSQLGAPRWPAGGIDRQLEFGDDIH